MKTKYTVILLFLFFLTMVHAQIQNSKNIPFDWKTDLSKHSVPLSEIQIVLPKGSFPTLDFPKFIDKGAGLNSFYAKEPVIAIEIDGRAKAYSLNILTMHEISNDVLSGVPILVTYCPLCNSGIVYHRSLEFNGKQNLMEFEPSGMLRNSDMVMLDRNTESLWQQLMGVAIVGELDKKELDIIPSLIISVEEFFTRYPQGEIMSKQTGFASSEKFYGTNPYNGYDNENSKPYEQFFDTDKIDKRLPPMERVVDIENNGEYKIYTFKSIEKKGVINDTFGNKNVVLFHKSGTVSVLDQSDISSSKDIGTIAVFNRELDNKILSFKKSKGVFKDTQTDSSWDITGYCFEGELKGKQLKIEPHSNHFAFAWLAFYPESEIYKK
jgi:uncharacterized protein DUF3179